MNEKAKKQVPVCAGYFEMPTSVGEKPRLIGSQCKHCGTCFFPKRLFCLKCGQPEPQVTVLSPRGKIWTYTVSHLIPPGAFVSSPYIAALVELPENVLIPTIITGCEPDNVDIGMEVEIYLEEIGEDREGNEVVSYRFRVIQRR